MGELEAQALDPDSWAVLLDENGNLTEGRGSNIFLVKDGEVSTPSRAIRAGRNHPWHGSGAGRRTGVCRRRNETWTMYDRLHRG